MDFEFETTRTGLANAFAAAGAELLAYQPLASTAVAPIPDTQPQKYTIAGTLPGILQMAGMISLEGLTRYNYAGHTCFESKTGHWVKFSDVESLLAAPAAAEQPTGDLTDEQIGEISRAHRNANGLLLKDISFARDIERAAIVAHLARQAQAVPVQVPGDANDVLALLGEADDLLWIASGAMLKMGLRDRGSDCTLPHEVREFSLEFSNEGRDGPGALQVRGTGRYRAWLTAVRKIDRAAPVAPVGAQNDDPRKFDRETTAGDYGVLNMAATFSTARQFGREFSESGLLSFVDALGAQNAEAIRNAVLEEAANALDLMNDSAGDRAAHEQREMLCCETERMWTLISAAKAIRALQTGSANTQEGGDHE
jgi:hypothetical protein